MKGFDESQALVETPFRLDSLAPTTAPSGASGDWYRYVIAQGTNTICGVRSGSRAELDLLLQQMVDRLNDRTNRQRAKLKR